jgi:hypothetical protein
MPKNMGTDQGVFFSVILRMDDSPLPAPASDDDVLPAFRQDAWSEGGPSLFPTGFAEARDY